jgi:hypothetical protein
MPPVLILPKIPADRAYELFEDGHIGESVDVLIHEQPFLVAAVTDVRETEVRQHYIAGMAVLYRALKREIEATWNA